MVGLSGLSAVILVKVNAWFELIFGLALFFGIYTRFVSLLLALHLANIAYVVGYNPTGVRDFGLMIATLSIFLSGSGPLSVDEWLKDKKSRNDLGVV